LIAASAFQESDSGLFCSDYLQQCTLAGGDDYELVFTAPPAHRPAVLAAARASDTPVTRIGVVQSQAGLRLMDAEGRPVERRYASFDHFA